MQRGLTQGAWVGGAAVLLLAASAAGAQRAAVPPDMPAAYRPPPGMCRVWLRNVPATQQPAPTECRTAWRTKPADATVVFGPEPDRGSRTTVAKGWRSDAAGRDDDARPPVRGAEACGDDNRDGICNQPNWTPADPCVEGDRDARCSDLSNAALPMMWSAVLWLEGQRPADLVRWFGGQNLAARFTMPARGGAPEKVHWFDQDNRLAQLWLDRNGDGRADRVEVYNREGVRLRVYGQ
jgi:hypothetical protein